MAKTKDFDKIGNSAVSKLLSHNEQDTHNTDTESNTSNTHNEQDTSNTQATGDKQDVSNTHNTDNEQKETKSKRLSLLIQPSLLEDFKKIAYIDKLSANELIIRLMKEYTEQQEQQEKIKKYDKL